MPVKNVGIITCSREPNYGACLQSYATQIVIERMGYSAEILNYTFEDEKSYLFWKHKRISTQIACVLYYRLRKSLFKAFSEYHEKMPYSQEIYRNVNDFQKAVDKYDIFLVGSDQVWNPELGIDTDITLLNFYTDGPKRISYASSFGISQLPDDCREKYITSLKQFDEISTREKQGKLIINDLLQKEVPIVLDPTLLLQASEWRKYQSNYQPKKKYVLVYDMQHSGKMIDFACRIAEKQGLSVYALSRIKIWNHKVKVLYGISPADFLSLVDHAEYVITDSFHGTIFSINYHKNFFAFCPQGAMHLSSRIINILDMLSLQDRLIDGEKGTGSELIDYNNVELKLRKWRNLSLQYLKNALRRGLSHDTDQ